ncbi:SCA7, zinc-binding domain-containing protein [Schizothecium vesticola]|uniref:SCA7, zinc-binding domain-containing protein n=1 Tax=Schizothecium vesticola TaxID=314040 RepID=A0AA40KBK7_9PEZI|nr:SCA7, zinc-binding domain-containing protein [Schizothecium vesticola]
MESRRDEEATIKVASGKNPPKTMANGTIKLSTTTRRVSKPGAWKEVGVLDNEEKKRGATKDGSIVATGALSPFIIHIQEPGPEPLSATRPLDESRELQNCKHCKKGILVSSAKEHIAQCLRIKKEKAQRKKEAREARERAKELAREEELRKADPDGELRGDDESIADDDAEAKGPNAGKTTTKATGKKPGAALGGKKRKAENELDKGKAKKKKDEPKPKAAKPKGPVDVERQCGVVLANGQPCARSLTCKSHSMGAKRAVPGRSLPYDMLLAAYQKKNQAKQQKAAIDANAPLEEEDDLNAAAVDSDEEATNVMAGLQAWRPIPVVPQPVFTSIQRSYTQARIHDQMMAATNNGRNNIFEVFSAPNFYGAEDAPGDPDVAMDDFSGHSLNFSLSGAPQRQPSVAGRA